MVLLVFTTRSYSYIKHVSSCGVLPACTTGVDQGPSFATWKENLFKNEIVAVIMALAAELGGDAVLSMGSKGIFSSISWNRLKEGPQS